MTVSTEAVLSDAPAPGRRTISVSFMARRNGGGDVLVYLLNVHVRPQPMVVDQVLFFFFLIVHVRPQLMIDDQVFRFAHGENDFLKKRILVHSPASSSTPAGWRQTLGVEQGSWTWLSSEAGPRKHVWFLFLWSSDAGRKSMGLLGGSSSHDETNSQKPVHLKYLLCTKLTV